MNIVYDLLPVENGGYHYQQPRKVQGISDDGSWVVIDGDPTPHPIDEVFVTPNTPIGSNSKTPPPNPFSGSSGESVKPFSTSSSGKLAEEWELPWLQFPLPRGNAIEIRMKQKFTPKEFAKIKQLLDLSEMSFVNEEEQNQG